MKIRPALAAACCIGGLALSFASSSVYADPTSGAAQLTFPPKSDCAFLGGDAGKRCEARRSGHASEYQQVRRGDVKLAPAPLSSSGGTFQSLSNGGSLGGLGESSTIVPTEEPATPSAPYNPNSIGNAWSGTPYDNGTGLPPR